MPPIPVSFTSDRVRNSLCLFFKPDITLLFTQEIERMTIAYDDFSRVDLRSGIVIKAEPFLRAKKPAYKVWVDFGTEIGIKQTSAQITKHYTVEELPGRLVVGCVNLEPRNIAGFISEFLLVGFADKEGTVCLLTVDPVVPKGQKLF